MRFFRFRIPNQIVILFLNSLCYQLICNIVQPALSAQTPNRFVCFRARDISVTPFAACLLLWSSSRFIRLTKQVEQPLHLHLFPS
jgi:hypothetical protein